MAQLSMFRASTSLKEGLLADIARCSNAQLLILASYDMASNVCQARFRPRHRTQIHLLLMD